MNNPTTKQRGPGAARILFAYAEAQKAKVLYVHKAVLTGQMLREQRHDMKTCHDGKSWNDPEKPDTDKFTFWLASECPDIPQRTAYRWMAAAERVMGHLLELRASANIPVEIELDESPFFISTVLTMPSEESTAAMVTFQQTFHTFLLDKTLTEAIACVLNPPDEESRITRAAKGKDVADQGDRKDFPVFIARQFHDISSHLRYWDNMTETQRTEIKSVVVNMIQGDEVKLGGREIVVPASVKGQPVVWPKDLCHAALEALRERLRK